MSDWWWKEYPERDTEYVRWYPPDIGPLNGRELWDNDSYYSPDRLGFYIHVPFCEEICPFCPYNKFPARDDDIERYLSDVTLEIKAYSQFVQPLTVPFIYFGGGTPSVLTGKQLDTILSCLSRHFPVTGDTEITVETNPITPDGRIADYHSAGANRLSFGFQSFRDDVLHMLGSHHTVMDCYRVIEAARTADFQNIGCDLMFRLPGQSVDNWLAELQQAVAIKLSHVSCYSMILDPTSPLARSIEKGIISQQPDEVTDMEMSKAALRFMRMQGYTHYASCASCGHDFALPDQECRYEKLHWGAPQVNYIGIGPGAYGFIDNRIYCNHHTLRSYDKAIRDKSLPVVAGKKLTMEDQMSRFMVLGLKCMRINKGDFAALFGTNLQSVFGNQLAQLKAWGLLEESDEAVYVSELGRLYVDNISKAFYNQANYRIPQPLEPELQLLSTRGVWKRQLLQAD
jgi:oxygen-independent coproporphyrinogen-3 oxidase